MIIRKHQLGDEVKTEILDCLRKEDPVDWYWRFFDSCSLTEDVSYELSYAMHLDAGIPFDYTACISTPYSPWTIH